MTVTPSIPDAAVQAAAEQLHERLCAAGPSTCGGHEHVEAMKPMAAAALAVALPRLGGIGPEFGLLRRGDSSPCPYPSLDHAENARRTEPGRDPDGRAELFVRYVTTWYRSANARRPR